jgi:hypothetical protein
MTLVWRGLKISLKPPVDIPFYIKCRPQMSQLRSQSLALLAIVHWPVEFSFFKYTINDPSNLWQIIQRTLSKNFFHIQSYFPLNNCKSSVNTLNLSTNGLDIIQRISLRESPRHLHGSNDRVDHRASIGVNKQSRARQL